MEGEAQTATASGFPELTELGKRIEMLRIQRGISKQHLARYAGTSRQQLWRVMTGKSELTTGLQSRLSDVLGVTMSALGAAPQTRSTTVAAIEAVAPSELDEFLARPALIERTLSTMPSGEPGRQLKRRFLDALEDLAMAHGHALEPALFELRRRVLSGQL